MNGLTILVVDDDPVTRARLKSYFESEDYQVTVASDGNGMWRILESVPADIVLLDIGFPARMGWNSPES